MENIYSSVIGGGKKFCFSSQRWWILSDVSAAQPNLSDTVWKVDCSLSAPLIHTSHKHIRFLWASYDKLIYQALIDSFLMFDLPVGSNQGLKHDVMRDVIIGKQGLGVSSTKKKSKVTKTFTWRAQIIQFKYSVIISMWQSSVSAESAPPGPEEESSPLLLVCHLFLQRSPPFSPLPPPGCSAPELSLHRPGQTPWNYIFSC